MILKLHIDPTQACEWLCTWFGIKNSSKKYTIKTPVMIYGKMEIWCLDGYVSKQGFLRVCTNKHSRISWRVRLWLSKSYWYVIVQPFCNEWWHDISIRSGYKKYYTIMHLGK